MLLGPLSHDSPTGSSEVALEGPVHTRAPPAPPEQVALPPSRRSPLLTPPAGHIRDPSSSSQRPACYTRLYVFHAHGCLSFFVNCLFDLFARFFSLIPKSSVCMDSALSGFVGRGISSQGGLRRSGAGPELRLPRLSLAFGVVRVTMGTRSGWGSGRSAKGLWGLSERQTCCLGGGFPSTSTRLSLPED